MVDQSDVQLEISQSVVVYFRCANDDIDPIHALGAALSKAIVDARVGVYDGHEVALLDGDDVYHFMYGPDADALFAAVQPALEGAALPKGAKVTLRYGSPDDENVAQRHAVIGA